ncbi:23S rRNA (adenine(2503)-C(2))-methyltransferase RlmN [Haloplasma contractile]|uniref:Probable dual-specificity RNA methyltransferase RlmN n=1 Tax=Haloplasma contractile SSD-17B TaxID=1033810 RepID=U2EFJ0_9MOLU|nr:23S rRNA (adenine(2503)-C(2))-methyltransferase RlmN [Haloplasma contractile]ERJ13426.1 putative dual-specificity RNA methyltransferase RlmN protein [Haloplasma contractile SSD-17B]
MKETIYSYKLDELKTWFKEHNEQPFRAKQVYNWLYNKRVKSFYEMTNIGKSLQDKLDQHFDIDILELETYQKSKDDGTIKYLYKLRDGHFIEAVLMRHDYGYSVCVTSQVGCKMGCTFCASTLGGVQRNLEAGEIVAQVIYIQRLIDESDERVSSIVLMGSGEPFDNFDAAMKFIDIINDEHTLNIGARHITVSTCGVVPNIYRFADLNTQVNFAVSLHATTNAARSMIMPVNRKYPIEDLLESIKYYNQVTNRRVSFEFGLLNGINDTKEEAIRLAKLIKHLKCHVNVIPINYVMERGYEKPTKERIKDFVKTLEEQGINATIRREKGSDIDAACGQLRAKKSNLMD